MSFLGAGYGNRFTFSPLAKMMVATSFCTGGRNCPPDSSTSIGSIHSLSKKQHPIGVLSFLEQGTGIEPAFTAWEAVVLPIYEPCK